MERPLRRPYGPSARIRRLPPDAPAGDAWPSRPRRKRLVNIAEAGFNTFGQKSPYSASAVPMTRGELT